MPIRSPQYDNENGTFFVNDKGEVVTLFFSWRRSGPRMAVSRDVALVKWESFPDLARYSGVPDEMKVRTDQSAVFKKGDTWYLVCTTVRNAKTMALPLYKSKDLLDWEYAGLFFEDATGNPVNECGQLFQLGGRYVFTSIEDISKDTQYMTGTIRADGTFERQASGVPDYASMSYNCVSTAVDDKGQATMWRYICSGRSKHASTAAGWYCTCSLSRDVRMAADNHLLFRPAPALEELRGNHVHRVIEADAADKPVPLTDFKAAQAEVQLGFQATTTGETGIRLSDGRVFIEAFFDHAKKEVVLDVDRLVDGVRPGKAPAPDNGTVTLRFFSDRSVFEIYADDEVVISTAGFFHDPENLKAEIFNRNGATTPVTVDAWEMGALKWSSYDNTKENKCPSVGRYGRGWLFTNSGSRVLSPRH